jgi:hypothetical protein
LEHLAILLVGLQGIYIHVITKAIRRWCGKRTTKCRFVVVHQTRLPEDAWLGQFPAIAEALAACD